MKKKMSFTEYVNDPLHQTEMTIGFTVGILIGVISSGVLILFFTPWQWYFKLFSAIGIVGMICTLLFQIYQTAKSRRSYLDVYKEINKLKGGTNGRNIRGI